MTLFMDRSAKSAKRCLASGPIPSPEHEYVYSERFLYIFGVHLFIHSSL